MEANVAKIESANFDRPLGELLGEIDFETVADHWLARFHGLPAAAALDWSRQTHA